MRRCETCEFWDEQAPYRVNADSIRNGLCRAHPPEVMNGNSEYPVTATNEWCGEHEPIGGHEP